MFLLEQKPELILFLQYSDSAKVGLTKDNQFLFYDSPLELLISDKCAN